MEHGTGVDAGLTLAVALAAGMICQALARHLRLPGIVLLLGAGVLLGPDLLDVVRPEAIDGALQVLVGFAVAVILFEGAINLNLTRLRSQAQVIPRLISLGALITAVTGGLTAWLVMGWDWRLAAPFGALVVVTGPTVITPLLRRIRVAHRVETILEAEGVLIDAIGAVLAVVTLEVVLAFSAVSVAEGVVSVLGRLGFGLLAGLAGGVLIGLALRSRKLVPDDLENVLTLSLVLVLFQASNALLPESGLMSVTIAGVVVGNFKLRRLRDLIEFKEQLTVLFIGMLFVLLAADVRVAEVTGLGWAGLGTVFVLILVVRPLSVFASAAGSDLTLREKVFLSWLAPRGVVAAAVASLFAQSLAEAGLAGGESFRALVFLVIAVTVVLQGLSGGWVAGRLGLRRPVERGFVVLGGNGIGHEIGRLLADAGHEVVFIDNSPDAVSRTQEAGFRVVYGSAVEERTLQRAELDERRGCLAVTTNEELNLLFADAASEQFRMKRIYVALPHSQRAVSSETLEKRDAQVLFGRPRDLDLWIVRVRRGLVRHQSWRLERDPEADEETGSARPQDFPEGLLLPLARGRGKRVEPVGHRHRPRRGDELHFLVFAEQLEAAADWLEARGWSRVEDERSGGAAEAAT